MTLTPYICDRCREPLVGLNDCTEYIIRPIRASKCKGYRAPGSLRGRSRICTGVGLTKEEAIQRFEHLTVVVPVHLG